MPVATRDVHLHALVGLVAAAAVVTVMQGFQLPAAGNPWGIWLCGGVLLGYIVQLLGLSGRHRPANAAGLYLVLVTHGYQVAYYTYDTRSSVLAMPPMCLAAVTLVYAGVRAAYPPIITA